MQKQNRESKEECK